MIEDLNKIRNIMKLVMAKHLKIFGKILFKEDLFALCALDMAH
jgi:hypothetical protein